jgi:hypothetical protein
MTLYCYTEFLCQLNLNILISLYSALLINIHMQYVAISSSIIILIFYALRLYLDILASVCASFYLFL